MRAGLLVCFGLMGCGGSVGDDDPVRTILPPLSVECVDHEGCLPATLGYATCRNHRCSFRCDNIVRSGETLTNAEQCAARGGECLDVGAGNAWCEAL